jgi:FAD/FMN-containing dehydrogenase
MALFNQVTYNQTTTLVEVGPGLIWEDVYAALAPYSRNVAGATTCQNVGVAGFNLGGGFSNKSNQFGLAIDSIQAIEVVTPSAEILTVTAHNHGDLFWALKVSFSQRAVVPISYPIRVEATTLG